MCAFTNHRVDSKCGGCGAPQTVRILKEAGEQKGKTNPVVIRKKVPAHLWICRICETENGLRREVCYNCKRPKPTAAQKKRQQKSQEKHNKIVVAKRKAFLLKLASLALAKVRINAKATLQDFGQAARIVTELFAMISSLKSPLERLDVTTVESSASSWK
eukprot:jgi/Bigna1/141192/aug1.61_g15900